MSQSPSPKTKAKMLAEAAQAAVAKKASSASFKRDATHRKPVMRKKASKAPSTSASFSRDNSRRTPVKKKKVSKAAPNPAPKAASPKRRRSTQVAIPELTQQEFNKIAQEKTEQGFRDPRRLGPHHHYTPDKEAMEEARSAARQRGLQARMDALRKQKPEVVAKMEMAHKQNEAGLKALEEMATKLAQNPPAEQAAKISRNMNALVKKLKESNEELMLLNQQYKIAEAKSLGVTTPSIVEPVSAPTSRDPRTQLEPGPYGKDTELTTLGKDRKGSSKKTKKSGAVNGAIRLGGIPAFKLAPGAAGKNRKGSKKKKKNKKGGFYRRCPNCGYN